jgi:hypothetical protein
MKRIVVVFIMLLAVSLSGCMFFKSPPAVLYEETFSGETASQWAVGETDYRNKWIEGGKYHMQITTAEYYSAYSWNSSQGSFDNFQLEADVIHINGANNLSALGLIFRVVDGNNYYLFRIGPGGTYYIGKNENGSYAALVNWTSSSAIHTGEATNHVTVYADGSSLTFFVNGEEIDDVVDGAFSAGYVGVIATTWAGNPNMHVAFDNLVVTELE